MATKSRPDIDCDRHHATLAVADVPATIDFYTNKLGFTLAFVWGGEPPTFAGLNLGDVQIFIQKGKPDGQAASVVFVVGNADDLYAYHRANGVTVTEEIADREYGIRDYGVRDNNGHHLSFGHNIFNQGHPIPIERVDVPVRLEKRLAALLLDLAAYKRMSLSSCLEEILLHTNEPLGDGVASPHTKGQLAHIQRLKAKHGIDYDSHASYRFVETVGIKRGETKQRDRFCCSNRESTSTAISIERSTDGEIDRITRWLSLSGGVGRQREN